MNIIKPWITAVLLMLSLQAIAQDISNDITQTSKVDADKAWEKRPTRPSVRKYTSPSLPDGQYTSAEQKKKNGEILYNYKVKEQFNISYLNWGIEFWRKFPTDSRRFQWLRNVVQNTPYFFKNMDGLPLSRSGYSGFEYPIDVNARKKWEENYNWMRKEFMTSPQITKEEKIAFEFNEFANPFILYKQRHPFGRNQQKFDLVGWTRKILFVTSFYNNSINKTTFATDRVIRASNIILKESSSFGLTYKEIDVFLTSLIESPYPSLRAFGEQKKSLFALRKEPFSLKFVAVNGSEIDLNHMKGKLVLLDFWSTNCSSCINKMPEVKAVYEKYQTEGFEVLSICTNPEIDKDRIIAIHHRIGANWPLLLIGGESTKSGFSGEGSLTKTIWKKYGFVGVPQLLLIGKDGLLVDYQGEMLEPGKLETVIKRNLNL